MKNVTLNGDVSASGLFLRINRFYSSKALSMSKRFVAIIIVTSGQGENRHDCESNPFSRTRRFPASENADPNNS
jgi:hypothetical protein